MKQYLNEQVIYRSCMMVCVCAIAVMMSASVCATSCTAAQRQLAHGVLDVLDEVCSLEDTRDTCLDKVAALRGVKTEAQGPTECPVVLMSEVCAMEDTSDSCLDKVAALHRAKTEAQGPTGCPVVVMKVNNIEQPSAVPRSAIFDVQCQPHAP